MGEETKAQRVAKGLREAVRAWRDAPSPEFNYLGGACLALLGDDAASELERLSAEVEHLRDMAARFDGMAERLDVVRYECKELRRAVDAWDAGGEFEPCDPDEDDAVFHAAHKVLAAADSPGAESVSRKAYGEQHLSMGVDPVAGHGLATTIRRVFGLGLNHGPMPLTLKQVAAIATEVDAMPQPADLGNRRPLTEMGWGVPFRQLESSLGTYPPRRAGETDAEYTDRLMNSPPTIVLVRQPVPDAPVRMAPGSARVKMGGGKIGPLRLDLFLDAPVAREPWRYTDPGWPAPLSEGAISRAARRIADFDAKRREQAVKRALWPDETEAEREELAAELSARLRSGRVSVTDALAFFGDDRIKAAMDACGLKPRGPTPSEMEVMQWHIALAEGLHPAAERKAVERLIQAEQEQRTHDEVEADRARIRAKAAELRAEAAAGKEVPDLGTPSTMGHLRAMGSRPLVTVEDGPRMGWGTYDDD